MMLFGLFAMTACVTEVDDVFDQNASQRIDTAIKDARQILETPKNGWRMEYYGDTQYGGYNVLMKFEGDSVIVASEKVGKSQNAGLDANGNVITAKSHYKIEQSMGVVVSFDEYNDIFHYFSDPRNDDYGSKGTGFEGDFEFRVMSISSDKIELKGKKHDTKIIMYPMDENTSWSDYLNQVQATSDFMLSRSYKLTFDGQETEIPAVSTYRRLRFTVTDAEGKRSYTYAPFIVTPKGYVFYNTVKINDVDLNGFDKGDTEDYFYAEGNNTVKLYTEVPTLYTTFTTGLWYLMYEDMGEYGKTQWNTLLAKLANAENNKRARLYYAVIGDIGTEKNYWGFQMSAGSLGEQIGGMTFSPVTGADGKAIDNRINIKWNSKKEASNNLGYKYYQNNKYGIKSAMDPFCGGFGHTFDLSSDNVRHPSYIILTDVDNPQNVIKVWSESKSFPFGDLDNDSKDK